MAFGLGLNGLNTCSLIMGLYFGLFLVTIREYSTRIKCENKVLLTMCLICVRHR